MAEGKDEKPTNPNNQLSDSDTLNDKPINPKLKIGPSGPELIWHFAI